MAQLLAGVQRYGTHLGASPFTLASSIFAVGATTVTALDDSGSFKSWQNGRASFLNTITSIAAYESFQILPGGSITTNDSTFSFRTTISTGGGSTPTGTTYYVSPTGNDNLAGTSPATAWVTITKVNAFTGFVAGDSILFQGGKNFDTTTGIILDVTKTAGGTASGFITVGSYDGRASIRSTAHGITVRNVPYVKVKDLIFVGSGETIVKNKHGIYFINDLATPAKIESPIVENCSVNGFPNCGIFFQGGTATNSGFNNVKVLNCFVDKCLTWGILTGQLAALTANGADTPVAGSSNKLHSNVYIAGCVVSNVKNANYAYLSGNGIAIGNCTTGVIEYCTAHDCGGGINPSGGGVAIWCYYSDNVVIQYCEAWNQMANTANFDGCGFDIDLGCNNCIVQYCYAHDNEGAGLLFYLAESNNVGRFNIFVNNSTRNTQDLAINASVANTSVKVYNNTIYGTQVFGSDNTNVGSYEAFNNLFIAKSGGVIVRKASARGTLFNNLYWEASGTFRVVDNGTTYNSLADWKTASSQEATGNGVFADPLLLNYSALPTGFLPGATNQIMSDRLKPSSVSPIVASGINPNGVNFGVYDFEKKEIGANYAGKPMGAFSTSVVLASQTEFRYTPRLSVTASGGLVSALPEVNANPNARTYSASGGQQPTLVASGLNNLPYLSFNGTSNVMSQASASVWGTPTSVFWMFVMRLRTNQANVDIMNTINGLYEFYSNASALGMYVGANNASNTFFDKAFTPNTWMVVSMIPNGANSKIWFNGGSPTTGSTGNGAPPQALSLGASAANNKFATLDLAELISRFPGEPTTAEHNALGQELATLYGLTWNNIT